MKNKTSFEKYNIILIILFLVVPILALNISFYLLSILKNEHLSKEQATRAEQEVETLASEADFGNEFAMLFRDFCNAIKDASDLKISNKANLTNFLEQKNNNIFKKPFPNYSLYLFKLNSKKTDSELIYYKGRIDNGKKALCKAFNILYELNRGNIKFSDVKNNNFIKTLIGKYSSIDVIANEKRGLPTFTNGFHKCSWFIWDYFNDKEYNEYGCNLLCDDINNYAESGRLLALERLRARGFATGAFIPVFKDFGKANILPPLDKSQTFLDWANSLTIQEEKDFYQ
ncbi:MAG: hypothetical protein J6Z11_15320, partial [Candidatus Riflebacteria bacterium]|nr:hypothetical protein [Candidatus Riflebacteria bacterium]